MNSKPFHQPQALNHLPNHRILNFDQHLTREQLEPLFLRLSGSHYATLPIPQHDECNQHPNNNKTNKQKGGCAEPQSVETKNKLNGDDKPCGLKFYTINPTRRIAIFPQWKDGTAFFFVEHNSSQGQLQAAVARSFKSSGPRRCNFQAVGVKQQTS